MKIVRQEADLISDVYLGSFMSYVALMPPTNVYRTTPTGKRKVAAMI